LSEGRPIISLLQLENARKQELQKQVSDMKTRITARKPISGGGEVASLLGFSLWCFWMAFACRNLSKSLELRSRLRAQLAIIQERRLRNSGQSGTAYVGASGKAYIYPTLLTIANVITEARLDKEKNIHTVNIYSDMSSFTQDKLYISYHKGHKKPHNSKIILLNQLPNNYTKKMRNNHLKDLEKFI
jgi:hypothetical protein